MVRRCLLLLLSVFVCRGAWALNVTTTLDKQEIHSDQSLVLTYEVDEAVDEPDFTVLESDFEIVSRSQRQSVSVAGGASESTMVWTLILMPKRTGQLTLPRIRFGSGFSDPLRVMVRSAPGRADVYVEYAVEDPAPYVNQQVLVTTQVYMAVDVEDLDVSEPRIAEGSGSLEPLGGPRSYQAVRGGRRYAVREQRYTLVPSASGTLTLTPVDATAKKTTGESLQAQSGSLKIQVVSAKARQASGAGKVEPEDLFLETEVDTRTPYVQEQVVYTIRLFRSVPVENAHLSGPAVSGGDAVIERITLPGFRSDRHYQTMRGDRQYAVTERRFAIFPQSAGTLTLEPLILKASMPLPSSGSNATGFWSQPLTAPVRIESDAIVLDVRTPPADAPRPWLPARSITLDEDWPARDEIEVGTPITRRVIVKAEALLASQLPELDLPLPAAMKSYPEQPRRESSAGSSGVSGRLEQTIALVPSEPGSFTVPAFELAWWNTGTDSKEVLRLPAHTFNVRENPSIPAADGASPETAADTPGRSLRGSPAGWWLSLGLGVAWLLTVVLWWRDRRRIAAGAGGKSDGAGTASRRDAEQRLHAACRSGDAEAARDALLDWARACWPDDPPRSLGRLASATNATVAGEIAALQQTLYAPDTTPWRGGDLYRAVASFEVRRPHRPGDGDVLKPLYGH